MSDLTIFGKTFTDVKGIKATGTDGNEVVYGGGYSIADVLAGSFGENLDLSGITSIPRGYLFADSTVKSINAPDLVASIPTYAFWNAKELETFNAPLLGNANEYAFSGCSKLSTFTHQYTLSIGQRSFENCASLPMFVADTTGVFTNTFAGCSSLEVADFGTRFAATRQNSFYNCAKLKTLIIRATALPPLQNINMFNKTPFASDGTGGTLYVPQSLISSYQSAKNWSTILGYANNQILPIEGSQYEHYYADGTPIE